jgi:hypothetical protein
MLCDVRLIGRGDSCVWGSSGVSRRFNQPFDALPEIGKQVCAEPLMNARATIAE